MKNVKNQYVDFSTWTQTVKICKISVNYNLLIMKTSIFFPTKHILGFDSAMLLTISRFSIFSMVKLWENCIVLVFKQYIYIYAYKCQEKTPSSREALYKVLGLQKLELFKEQVKQSDTIKNGKVFFRNIRLRTTCEEM